MTYLHYLLLYYYFIIDGCSDTSNIDFDYYVEKGVYAYDRLNEKTKEMNRYEVYCNEVNLI